MIPAGKKKIIRRGEKRAKFLARLGLYYVFGGGHSQTPVSLDNRDFDCSSFVSHELQVMGFDCPTTTTYGLAAFGEAGAGKYVTVHIKNPPDPHEAHVILEFKRPGKRSRFVQCGGRDNTSSRGGPCYFKPTASRLAEFDIQRHPKGY